MSSCRLNHNNCGSKNEVRWGRRAYTRPHLGKKGVSCIYRVSSTGLHRKTVWTESY